MTQTSKLHKIQIYQFKGFDMDAFVNKYLLSITPHETIDEDTISVFRPAQFKMSEAKRGARSKTIIEAKCRYLQDAIIRMANRKHDDKTFSLNAEILKSVIGKEYKTMIETIIEMGYISMGDGKWGTGKHYYYQQSRYSTLYTLNDVEVYLTEPFINLKIQEYKEKTIEKVKEQFELYTKPEIIRQYGESFLKSYLKSLNKIKIEDEQGLKEYIKTKTADNPNSNPYYRYISIELKNKDKSIYRIDDSHRIYHILTNLDRNIKQYLNINLSLDCKNSHPLLFNYFIFNKLNISFSKSYNISSFIKSIDIFNSNISNNSSFHNLGKNLRNILISNNIEIEQVAKMKDDELEYIYKTSKGLLWDEICEAHPELDRKKVKVAMFQAVFYSHSPVADRWNDYAKEFKSHYPSVYKLIGDWKRKKTSEAVKNYMAEHHLPTEKGSASLSVAMMALEADIFTAILQRLYSKRWNALHIHDCIIIPKTDNKNQPTKEEVVEIMQDVYRSFGLAPTFD